MGMMVCWLEDPSFPIFPGMHGTHVLHEKVTGISQSWNSRKDREILRRDMVRVVWGEHELFVVAVMLGLHLSVLIDGTLQNLNLVLHWLVITTRLLEDV